MQSPHHPITLFCISFLEMQEQQQQQQQEQQEQQLENTLNRFVAAATSVGISVDAVVVVVVVVVVVIIPFDPDTDRHFFLCLMSYILPSPFLFSNFWLHNSVERKKEKVHAKKSSK